MKYLKTLFVLLILTATAISADLNNMSKAEYTAFNKAIFEEYKTDPHGTGEKAAQILITMAGLESRPEGQKMFRTDVVFTINSMLLLVANANKVKRQGGFIEEYKKQASGVEGQLSGEALISCQVFTSMVISENEKLP